MGESVPEKGQDFRGVSLKRELVEEIEHFISDYPQYKSIADFVHESVRVRMGEVRRSKLPRFEVVNFDEQGTKIYDRELKKIVQLFFKPNGVWCQECQTAICSHLDYAYKQPNIQKMLKKKRKEGWNIPELG